MDWREFRIWCKYLAKRPLPEERIEYMLAYQMVQQKGFNSKNASLKVSEFMLFKDNPWKAAEAPNLGSSRYSEVDRSLMKALQK